MAARKAAAAPESTKPVPDYQSPDAIAAIGGAPNAPKVSKPKAVIKTTSVRLTEDVYNRVLDRVFNESTPRDKKTFSDIFTTALLNYLDTEIPEDKTI